MVAYETASKIVLGLGSPDPSFVARGQQNFARFATVLNELPQGARLADGRYPHHSYFSVAGLVPSAERMQLPVKQFPEIVRLVRCAQRVAGVAPPARSQGCVNGCMARLAREQSSSATLNRLLNQQNNGSVATP